MSVEADPAGRRTTGWGRAQVLVSAMLVVALAAALVCVAVLWRERQHTEALARAGEDAENAARAAAVRLTSYDHDTVDADFAWVRDGGTADFQAYFTEVSEPAVAQIKALGADARGSVLDAATRVEDTEHVTVLLFVDQEITTTTGSPVPASPGIDQPRVTMSMVLDDGAWLVDAVSINQAP